MPRLSKIGAAALAAFGWTGLNTVSADFLVIAGGGGGGSRFGGGGGAGGLLTGTTSLNPTLSYTVTVGAGGTGGPTTGGSGTAGAGDGSNGSDSVFNAITSTGGGGGGAGDSRNGLAGGSGGGGAGRFASTGGAATAGQGNAGGGSTGGASNYYGGGGGGAGAVGTTGSNSVGTGGVGVTSSITGTSTYYAGGGGSAGDGTISAPGSSGGLGGGGAGGITTGVSGTANLGGGGGGGGNGPGSGNSAGGQGGSGVVIISYVGAQQFGGGIVTSSGGNTIHTFQTSGTLSPLSTLSASYLIVAGGGGGGTSEGGGGGAGGMQTGSGLTIDTNSIYAVTVGAGGTGATNGANSSFSSVSTASVGGGAGGISGNGSDGGSGGGGGANGSGTTSGGTATSGQGNAGGTGAGVSSNRGAGGGGGASAVGGNGTGSSGGIGGAGGNGSASSISGSSVTYAGGGGGNSQFAAGTASGGSGGGGTGGNTNSLIQATNGTANLGGGGGGGSYNSYGGIGGSGVVVISYAGATQLMAGGTVTISGGNVIHTFTSSGYLTPLTLVSNSLRTRRSASAFLNRTFPTAGNTQKFTQSIWTKRGTLGASQFFGVTVSGNASYGLYFETDSSLYAFIYYTGSVWQGQLYTTQLFRDPAAWYHIVLAVDTTQAVASNRVKIYVNSVQVTSFTTENYPNQNQTLNFNSAAAHFINQVGSSNYYDGYITELNWIDGQQLTPNSFGTFNSFGVWQPIVYGGSYGTNGFYLPFNPGTSTFVGSFNGSNQSLSLAQNAAFNFGTGDFTIEACVYGNSWNSVNPIIALGDGAVGGGSPIYSGWVMRYDSANGLGLYRFDGSETSLFSGATVPVNTWNHMAISRSSGTLRMFINGVQVYSAANTTSYNNVNSNTLKIGGNWTIGGGVVTWVNGYISNVRIVNNAGLYTTNFTPPTANLTAVSGTALLTLQNSSIVDNSTNAFTITNNNTVTTGQTYPFSAAKIFNDQSPQGNNWTPNNIGGGFGSTLDYMTDVPTLTSATAANYCTLNPALPIPAGTISQGNLNYLRGSTSLHGSAGATFTLPTTGKWYWEVTACANSGGSGNNEVIGVANILNNPQLPASGSEIGSGSRGDYAYRSDGNKYNNGNQGAYGATYTNGDVIGVAWDSDAGTLVFYKNGSSQGTAFSSIAQVANKFVPASSNAETSNGDSYNFGQRPFAYTAPSGFLPLNTFNL